MHPTSVISSQKREWSVQTGVIFPSPISSKAIHLRPSEHLLNAFEKTVLTMASQEESKVFSEDQEHALDMRS